MEYILAARERCEFLMVGITNPDPLLTAEDQAAPARSVAAANPFTYYERAAMVRDSLCGAGVPLEAFMVVPFPINRPELLRHYTPTDATFFLTIYDDWGRAKLGVLRSLHLSVDILWDRPASEKPCTGTEVRRRIAAGEPWEHLVPPPAAKFIRDHALEPRVAQLVRAFETQQED
jgi:nicotinamide-nucleotide adenylyltransferase